MKTSEYLLAVKQKQGISSDYALAQFIGISRQTISQWKAGIHFPDVDVCFTIADILNIEPQAVIADVEIERAARAGKEHELRDWQQRARRLNKGLGSYTLALLLAFLSLFVGGGPDAGAMAATPSPTVNSTSGSLYIM